MSETWLKVVLGFIYSQRHLAAISVIPLSCKGICIHLKFLFYLLVHLVHQQFNHLFPVLCQHVRHHILEVPLFLLQLQNNVLLHLCTQLFLQIVKQMIEEFMSCGCHCCGFLSAVCCIDIVYMHVWRDAESRSNNDVAAKRCAISMLESHQELFTSLCTMQHTNS